MQKPEEGAGLPFSLTVSEMAKLMGVNLTAGYNIARRPDFPKLIIGKRIVIPTAQFLAYVDRESCKRG